MNYFWTLLIGVILIAGCSKHSATSKWAPPANPDPSQILNDAEADARAGNYPAALAKHVWFFQNALKYNEGLYGVRLSFALSDWVKLGKVYPPALEKLKAFRDEAESNIRKQTNIRDNFHDFESINKELSEESKTVALFVWLDSNQSNSAKQVFDLAEPALVISKEYRLCGKYIDADASFNQVLKSYRTTSKIAQEKLGKRVQDFADNNFKNETTTLIALLVVNNRKAEAQKIADKISKEPNLPEFKDEIQKALNGEVPPPWP
jgi:hypothetical protein